jgi:aryl-phospho-beta-D-glucosidase BglC (GH1 family)
MGRYIDTINPYNTQFSDLALTDSFESILSTLISGPNRTQPFPTGLDKIYGVNIGNWLIFEPWMAPGEWKSMGGEYCGDCSKCIQSEWQLANSLSQDQTNKVFQKHWESWFTQADVDAIVSFNLNTVRIPLGFWIVEGIVHRDVEPYAEGGLIELVRGLNMLREAGIAVILDQHALPGVSASNQMFAGNCTTRVNFYVE